MKPLPPAFDPITARALRISLGLAGVTTNDQYVGQYYARENSLRTVRREGDRLLLQELGKPSCEVFPLSETNFYNQLFDCRATFVRDDNSGRGRELILGDVANPRWRGTRIPGQPLQTTNSPLAEGDCPPREGSDLQGVWKATLRPWYWPFMAYHLKIRIAEPSAGSFRAEADSLDQGVTGQPLCVIYNRPDVEVVVLSGDGLFQGKINPSHAKVTGVWKQAGHSIRVTFRRVHQNN